MLCLPCCIFVGLFVSRIFTILTKKTHLHLLTSDFVCTVNVNNQDLLPGQLILQSSQVLIYSLSSRDALTFVEVKVVDLFMSSSVSVKQLEHQSVGGGDVYLSHVTGMSSVYRHTLAFYC